MVLRARASWAALLLVVAVTAACPGPRTTADVDEPVTPEEGQPEAELSLSDWSVRDLRDLAFVSIGLLKESGATAKLVIYDVREHAPQRQPPDTIVWRSSAPMLDDGAYVLSHFDGGNYNRLGGTFSAFQRAPSQSHVDLRHGQGLRLRWKKAEPGYAGVWMHLYDDRVRPAERTYLHTGAAAFIYFEIRGIKGGEDLTLRVADRSWDDKGDSLPIGKVALFVPGGHITRDWQVARVPLSALPRGIEHEELASIILAAETKGTGEVLIRNLALVADESTEVPRGSEQKRGKVRPLQRALWVWRTQAIVADSAQRDALLAMCESEQISDVFLQLLPPKKGRLRSASDLAEMLPLIAALHDKGVRVQALDGAPEFALKAHHAEVLATTRAVIESNRKSSAAERFDGIRFDNEPYLLPGFAGPQKESILRDYLEILDRVHVMTMAAKLPLGADIPFWFDGHDRFQEPIARLDGRPLSELVMDRVENIAIMAYRTSVYGPDGVIAHCLDELEYAELTGKEVLIALESVRLPDETLQEFTPGAAEGDFLLLRSIGKGKLRATWFAEAQESLASARAAASPGARLLRVRFEATAPSDKLSFHKRSRAAMSEAMASIADELSGHSSLRGFAMHAYDSLRKLE